MYFNMSTLLDIDKRCCLYLHYCLMGRLLEGEVGVPLSPIELEGLREVEQWNAQQAMINSVGHIECEAMPSLSVNGQKSFGRLDYAAIVTPQFVRRSGLRRWRLTERPHRHESLKHNPVENSLVNRRIERLTYVKSIGGEKKRLPNPPVWRLRIPSVDTAAYDFTDDVLTETSVLNWQDPEGCLRNLESKGDLEPVVDFTPIEAAIAGREACYLSQIEAAPFLPPHPQSL